MVMKALVTGGGGFLAGHLIDKLVEADHSVRAVELPGRDVSRIRSLGVEVIEGDLCNPEVAERACRGMEVVFNVAALCASVGPWERFWAVNVELTENMIAGCKKAGARRLVQVSSASAVFDGSDHVNADETLPYPKRFLNHYSATKAISEQRALAANGPDLETVVVRPHTIWGPRDRTLFPRILQRAKAGKLKQIGDGENVISTVYVENAAQGLLLAATGEKAPGQVYFITDAEPVKLWDFLRRIIKDLGLPPIKGRVPYSAAYAAGAALETIWAAFRLQGEPLITRYTAAELAKNHSYSIKKARAELGYEPTIDREEGLKRFYEWAEKEVMT